MIYTLRRAEQITLTMIKLGGANWPPRRGQTSTSPRRAAEAHQSDQRKFSQKSGPSWRHQRGASLIKPGSTHLCCRAGDEFFHQLEPLGQVGPPELLLVLLVLVGVVCGPAGGSGQLVVVLLAARWLVWRRLWPLEAQLVQRLSQLELEPVKSPGQLQIVACLVRLVRLNRRRRNRRRDVIEIRLREKGCSNRQTRRA